MYKRQVAKIIAKKFGDSVDLVLFGDTHEELVCEQEGVMFLNPGSPTYPGSKHAVGSLGTLAILDIRGKVIQPQIIDLER